MSEPKISPYLKDLTLVGKRIKILKPNGEVILDKQSLTKIQPLFPAGKAPKPNGTIKVLKDERGLKSVLRLGASGGDCPAMLPNIQTILQLSDALLRKLEDIQTLTGPTAPKIYRGNDLLYITKEAKNLFRPHGLPQQIAKIPNMITFSDGLKLREICKQIRDQHWSYICLRKNQFREKVWQMMHVERIPCGNLRESFIYSFQTYLPAKSNFPMIWDNPLPW